VSLLNIYIAGAILFGATSVAILFGVLCLIAYHLSRNYTPQVRYGPVPLGRNALHVILVHGTWARGMIRVYDEAVDSPRWFEKGSTFFEHFDEALKNAGREYVIDTLLWSGANSILERDRAAKKLAAHLMRVHEP
jgi:hypothetical protein